MTTVGPLLVIELVIILMVIFYQLYHSFRVYRNIKGLAEIFSLPLVVKNGYIDRKYLKTPESIAANLIYTTGSDGAVLQENHYARITVTESAGTSEIISRISQTINTYLLYNYGAPVNFSIIRDIIDRETETKDEEISQSIPTPLYLGLAATMVGIIFGLLAMPDIDGTNFTEGVNRLIDGVRLALTASLTGLLCTTLLSSFFYKRAKKQTLILKNNQLSYLQARLLPELIKAEETGVAGLKTSLDHFSREAATITGNVHLSSLQTGENLRMQDSIIARLERMDMVKVSKANLEMFSMLEKNMEAFRGFSEYLTALEEIASNLKEFAVRTLQIERISGQIDATLAESRDLVRFLNLHFDKIENAGTMALKAVDLTDSHFRESVELLKARTNASVETLFTLSDKTESDLRETLGQVAGKITEATQKHIEEFMSVYSEAVPRFRNLELLQPILDLLTVRSDSLLSRNEKTEQSVLALLNELSAKMDGRPHTGDGLEQAIRELTIQMKDKNPGPPAVAENRLGKPEMILRIIAWSGVAIVSILMILSWFKIA